MEFISYFEAKQFLEARLHATQDEIAQWVSVGAKKGGLDAYTINEPEQPILFTFNDKEATNDDYIKPLKNLYFSIGSIEQFYPVMRYITRSTLIKRWRKLYLRDDDYDDPEEAQKLKDVEINKFHLRINESDYSEYHPIAGLIQPTEHLSRRGLFDIDDVQKIEAKYKLQKSRNYKIATNYKIRRENELAKKSLDDDEDEEEHEYERNYERQRDEFCNRVALEENEPLLVPYDEFMVFSEKKSDIEYGEPELHLGYAISLFPALNLLGNDWVAEELALHLFNGTVRAFEKSGVDGMLRPIVNIQDWLIQYGKCVSFDDKQYSIKDALVIFNFSKLELTQFKPKNRYISFQQAQSRIATLIDREIYDAELYLIDVLKQQQIYAFHFFLGQVTQELSSDGELWRNGYFASWQLNRLIESHFVEKECPPNTDETSDVNGEDSQQDKADKIRTGAYMDRDLSADAWSNGINGVKPDIEGMTITEIKNALLTINRAVWKDGFDDWNRDQKVWPKKRRGPKRQV